MSLSIRDRVAEMRAKEQAFLSDNHVLQLRSSGAEFFWTISAADCQSVAWQLAEGVTLRPGGFRDTIRLLMLAGF